MDLKLGAKNIMKPFRRYPLLLDTVCLIIQNVFEGIIENRPVHMSLGPYSLLSEGNMYKDFSMKRLVEKLSNYRIIASDAAISSVYINLDTSEKEDVFEEGEFIYTCQTGYFHFTFNENGALSNMFLEFDGKTPDFLTHLVIDFPGNNYLPDENLLKELSFNTRIDNDEFLSGLYPWRPIILEID
jgi:hypothetical protein